MTQGRILLDYFSIIERFLRSPVNARIYIKPMLLYKLTFIYCTVDSTQFSLLK